MRVAPSSCVPGWMTVSRPMVDVDVDPGGGGVDDGHARALVGRHDAPVQFGGQIGQLHPVVDARHECGVVDVLGPHDLTVAVG